MGARSRRRSALGAAATSLIPITLAAALALAPSAGAVAPAVAPVAGSPTSVPAGGDADPGAGPALDATWTPGPYRVGDDVTWTVAVTGAADAAGATGVVVAAPLPAGLAPVAVGTSRGTSYDRPSGTWTAGTLAAGERRTLVVVGRVLVEGTHVGVAQLAGDEGAGAGDPAGARRVVAFSTHGAGVGGVVWRDLDGDGRRGVGEPGLAGVEVAVVPVGADGVAATADDGASTVVTTAADGTYVHTGLAAGGYAVAAAGAPSPVAGGVVLGDGQVVVDLDVAVPAAGDAPLLPGLGSPPAPPPPGAVPPAAPIIRPEPPAAPAPAAPPGAAPPSAPAARPTADEQPPADGAVAAAGRSAPSPVPASEATAAASPRSTPPVAAPAPAAPRGPVAGALVLAAAQVAPGGYDLAVAPAVEGELVAGEDATLVVTVVNKGPGTAPAPVALTIDLPSELVHRSSAGDGWTCRAEEEDLIECTHAAPLAAGSAAAVRVEVTVGGQAGGVVSLAARVTAGGTDADASDDLVQLEQEVVGEGDADPDPAPGSPWFGGTGPVPGGPAGAAPGAPLPHTGSGTGRLVALALLLVAGGTALRGAALRGGPQRALHGR